MRARSLSDRAENSPLDLLAGGWGEVCLLDSEDATDALVEVLQLLDPRGVSDAAVVLPLFENDPIGDFDLAGLGDALGLAPCADTAGTVASGQLRASPVDPRRPGLLPGPSPFGRSPGPVAVRFPSQDRWRVANDKHMAPVAL